MDVERYIEIVSYEVAKMFEYKKNPNIVFGFLGKPQKMRNEKMKEIILSLLILLGNILRFSPILGSIQWQFVPFFRCILELFPKFFQILFFSVSEIIYTQSMPKIVVLYRFQFFAYFLPFFT